MGSYRKRHVVTTHPKIIDAICKLLKENKKLNNKEIRDNLGVSQTSVTRYLDELENEGKVEQVYKSGPYVYYKLS